jgi:hypothetical protein
MVREGGRGSWDAEEKLKMKENGMFSFAGDEIHGSSNMRVVENSGEKDNAYRIEVFR